MKKVLFSFLTFGFCTLLLTGCGGSKNVVCTYTGDSGDSAAAQEVSAELDKDGKVSKVTGYVIYNSKEDAEKNFQSAKSYYGDTIELDGKRIILKDLQERSPYSSTVGYTKDEFIDYVKNNTSDQSKLTCK